MAEPKRFPFQAGEPTLDPASLLPYLPLTLTRQNHSLEAAGLLDTGATVNVLPYDVGRQLGAEWQQQSRSVQLSGNLAQYEAKALLLTATVEPFAPVRLVFAWTQSNEIPLILGQVNFFMEFDVCFYRAQGAFALTPKQL